MLTCALIVWILQPVNFDYTELRETFLTEQECIQQGIDEGRITNSSTNDDIDKELQKCGLRLKSWVEENSVGIWWCYIWEKIMNLMLVKQEQH